MKMFKWLKLRKRVKKDGVLIETSFALFLNNQDMIQFPSRDALQKYLKEYRTNNEIFKMQLYRIETYSL